MKLLTIIRGVSGSGKTTLAKAISAMNNYAPICEADMYFERNGVYMFDARFLPMVHDWCKHKVRHHMNDFEDHIIVSNTFTTKWEIQPYIDLANEHGYDVQIIDVQGVFGNVHNVPMDVVIKQKERWENITLVKGDKWEML